MPVLNSRNRFVAVRFIAQSIMLCAFVLVCGAVRTDTSAFAQSQANAADLRGYVRDPQNAAVPNVTVSARNPATNFVRTTTTSTEGFYQLINLPPGTYEVSAEAANFSRAVLQNVTLTVGQTADLDVPLQLGKVGETVTVSAANNTELIETARTAVSTTIDQQRIDNLPINQRDYINFSLTTSTVTRDNGRPIGPAPTTGLNFGGQRGRSNLVQVDGADYTDNSVNAARSTVSQEAVQEFQVVTNSFAPEFGRSSGGVVNVVTKSGTNNLHGDIFGFIRHRSIQARNAFAPIVDPSNPGKKPPFTRTQYGGAVGGALAQDRTFFFASFEQRRRQETGFFTSNVRLGLNSSVTIGAPFFPAGFPAQTFSNITSAQAGYVNGLLQQAAQLIGAGQIAQGQAVAGAAIQYAYLASSGGSTGLFGSSPLLSAGGAIPAGQAIGGRFFLSGAPVPVNALAFRPLTTLAPNYPIKEATTFSSMRVDHRIDDNNLLTMRVGYNRSFINGIQVESQNQSLGQNDFSRTGVQITRDPSFVATLNSTLSNRLVNEARFNFGRRRAQFTSGTNGEVAANISGTAFIGQELFSPVDRTENRYEFTDTINFVAGNHSFKFGGDFADIGISYRFDLNFAGVYNFGGLSATTLAAFPGGAPDFTPVQQYGLGFPSNYVQRFGNPRSGYTNRPVAFFAQDTWKVRPNITLNYGVRYDIEFTKQIAPVGLTDPLSGISLSASDLLAAQDAVGAQQGIPRDKNNFAPRLGVAWDLKGDGKTVVRAAFGLFYDHPLLAIAANSDIADAAQQQQGVFISGSPSPLALLNATQIFQGTVIVCRPGLTPGVSCTPGAAVGSNYQFGRQRFDDQTFPGFGPVLPFSLPVAKDFQYAYADQGNVAIERQITKDMSLTASYLFVGAHHLPHPLDVNAPDTNLQIQNFVRYVGSTNNILFPLSGSTAALVSSPVPNTVLFPTTAPGSTFVNPITKETFVVIIPGIIVQGPRGRVISPAIANFFRPNAPNYFLAQAASGGLVTPAVLNSQLAGTLRTPGLISPFGSVNLQVSDGNSSYNAATFELKRRFANNFQFLASYTWSHSIDDSSDLQTLLLPQDNRNFRAERADSLFDQRHRFVFSGVLSAPSSFKGAGGVRSFLAGFILAPIVEISSGRPFNILTNQDTNNDQSSQTDRPNVNADGTLSLPAPFTTGNLGRNRGILRGYASFDMRVARTIPFGERVHLDVIAEGFNLFNRFNQAAASPFFTDVNAFAQRDGGGRYFSRSTSAFDPRQFQFALKLYF